MTVNTSGTWPIDRLAVAMSLAPGVSDLPVANEESPYELLLQALESHIANEAKGLGEYRRIADSSPDPIVRLLMGLVLEDEERHHVLMGRLATRLRDDLRWTCSVDALPTDGEAGASPEEWATIRSLIFQEQEGIRQLRVFDVQAEGIYEGLPSLLLQTMIMDSEKHERILRFIYRRLGSRLKDERLTHRPS